MPRAWLVALLPVALGLVCLFGVAEAAWGHGGRGVRAGATGLEQAFRLDRLTPADLTPEGLTPEEATGESGPAHKGAAPRDASARGVARTVRAADYDWRQWWAVNRWSVLPDRAALLRRRARWDIEAGRPLPDVAKWRRDQREQRRFRALHDILPALERALAVTSKEGPEVRATALLALGKCAREAAHVDVLLAYAGDDGEPAYVRRCAALGLGLLRRSRPEDRFSGEQLDAVRRRLLALFDDEGTHRTVRAFAAYALGLLGDQPFGKATLEGRVVAREVWKRLDRNYRAHDLPVALLTALSMHPRDAMPPRTPEGLRKIVDGAWIHKRRWNHYERGNAMSAQARLHANDWNRLVWYVNSTQRQYPTFIRMSTFLALADQVADLPPDYRYKMAVSLIVSMRAARNTLTRGLAHVAMARLLNEDLRQRRDRILEDTRAFKWLAKEARYRGEYYVVRSSFAALGLGLAAHDLAQDVEKGEAVRIVAARTLKNILASDKNHLFRASCVAALGCTEHEEALPPLLALLGERPRLGQLEIYFAPVALGQIGRRTPQVLNALRGVYARKKSSAELRSQVLLAQVMLGDPAARQHPAPAHRFELRAAHGV